MAINQNGPCGSQFYPFRVLQSSPNPDLTAWSDVPFRRPLALESDEHDANDPEPPCATWICCRAPQHSVTIYRRSKNPRPLKIAGIAFSIRAVRVPDRFAPVK